MKVLCLPEPGNLVIKDLPMPELKEGQAIVKMEMCGICGSDVTAYRGVNPTMRYPINGLGHEGVGKSRFSCELVPARHCQLW